MTEAPHPAPREPGRESASESGLEAALGRALFAARYLAAPIYAGLLMALVLIVVKVFQKLIASLGSLFEMDISEMTLAVLQVLDLSLLANMVLVAMFAGWDNFVAPLRRGTAAHSNVTETYQVDFGGLKHRLIASVAAIACVHLLETFIHIDQVPASTVMWQLAILLGIAATGLLLAAMDRLARE